MSWKKILKEENIRDYVLQGASSGKSMGDSLREFAQKFPDKVPPPEIVEQSIKDMEKLEENLKQFAANEKRMKEAKIRHEQRGKELAAEEQMTPDERFKRLYGQSPSEIQNKIRQFGKK